MRPLPVPNTKLLSHWFDALASQRKQLTFQSVTAANTFKVMLYQARRQYKALWHKHITSASEVYPLDALYISHDKGSLTFSIIPNPVWNIVEEMNGVIRHTQFDKCDPHLQRALCMEIVGNAAAARYAPVLVTAPIRVSTGLNSADVAAALAVVDAAGYGSRLPSTEEELAQLRAEDKAASKPTEEAKGPTLDL